MPGEHLFDDLFQDLLDLRKNEGCTPARMRESGTVISILGGTRQPFKTLKARFVSAICAIPNQQDTELLLAVFSLSESFTEIPLLEKRQELYGKQIGRSRSTVARRESAAVRELALSLISARYGLSPLPKGLPPMHSTAIHERVDITVVVRDRLWMETRETFHTIPLIDGVTYFDVSSDIPATIEAISDVVAETASTGSGLKHRFIFKEPLKRGRTAVLSYLMRPDGTRAGDYLKEETRAFHLPTLAHGMEIIFIGEKPKLIWHYSQLPLFERPGIPTKEQLIDLSGGSTVHVEWNDLYGGLYSGIAWEWAD